MDAARKKADKKLEELEDRIRREYESAKDDITKQWRGYMERADERIASARRKYDAVYADKTASPDDIKKARKDLESIKTSVTLRDERYREVVDGFTDRLANVNSIAISYANDSIPSLYAIGYNQAGNDMQAIGMSFTLYNEDVVKNLIKQGDVKFPAKKLNIPKDKRWNTKQINSAVLQGILQGESMDKIANRIYPIVDRNANAAIRSARTLVTGAENKGRLDSYKRMEQSGVVLNKVWLSTPDGRTRDWHVDMDGQTVPVNEMFIDGLGNELEYPGDPGGAPESVYNCRCTMYADIIGFRRADGSISYVDYSGIDTSDALHDEQMQKERERREDIRRQRQGTAGRTPNAVVQGRDITADYRRRAELYGFEIEDVINQQGFDGLPSIVYGEQFDKAVRENGIILKRGYTAPNAETLKTYQDALYSGQWYVDCSKGGAAFGQGMYSVGGYGTELNERMQSIVEGYGRGEAGRIETFTIANGRFINSDAITKEKWQSVFEMKIKALDEPLTENQTELFKLFNGYPATDEERKKGYELLKNKEDVKIASEASAKVARKPGMTEKTQEILEMDDGVFAAMKGYDAIEVASIVKGTSTLWF